MMLGIEVKARRAEARRGDEKQAQAAARALVGRRTGAGEAMIGAQALDIEHGA